MALNPQVLGTDMPHGFAGCYARLAALPTFRLARP